MLALCVEKPLVGLIIRNIPGARERNNPDINWVPALAVQTRAQAKRERVTSKLKTPSIIDITINSEQVSNAQKEDVSLTTTRRGCEANETIGKATFFKKNDLLYRKFSSPNVEQGKIFEQLIVPEQYRELVILLAHESIFTGHLSVTNSVHKVLSEYYWPGIYKDFKHFVQACDFCKSSLHDGKTGEVSAIIESATGMKNSVQQHQVSKTLQVNETIDNTTSTLSEEQATTFNATFMVVGACQTFQNDDYSCTTSQVSEALSDVTSAKPIEKCATVQVSTSRSKQNENEALMERQPTEDGRKTVCIYQERQVSFCNTSDEDKTSPDDFDRKDVLEWIVSFMAMMRIMMASCIGQWTCTLGEIFRKGTECCSKRIRGWLLTGCFIEWCGISIVLLL